MTTIPVGRNAGLRLLALRGDPEQLLDIQELQTISHGKTVYQKD